MLVEVKVPVLAESVTEATLMAWHKRTGEEIKRGDSLIDIETDKVTLEIAAPNNGVLAEIIRESGDIVTSDEVIALIDIEVTADDLEPVAISSTPEQQELPTLDKISMVDESPKLNPAARNMVENMNLDTTKIERANDDRLTKSDVINHIEESREEVLTAETKVVSETDSLKVRPVATAESAPAPESEPKDSESIKPPSEVEAEPKVISPSTDETSILVATSGTGRNEKRVKMTRLRQRVAERLLSAQHENAILTTFNEVNMRPVMDLRQRYKEEFEKTHGVRLGFMSFFTKAAIEALKKFPIINASVDNADILYHNYFDIGIAISSPRGLVVPIIRDADTLSLPQIEKAVCVLSEKAQQSTLSMDDLIGGTFTITNGGIFGSLLSTPIINPPQSAILGMHKIQQRPVVENDEMVIRPMMYLALSYDHRIIDGREAVQFLVVMKELLEDPTRLLLKI